MYLKSLELHGFKSFPNRTVLHFDRGATVIVGPNGSGKSNISDAMRWVLGELSSRNLRGSKMEDVIFGGADSKRPMGFAEVSVTFDNSEKDNRIDSPYDEITVSRRYFRSGNSEYQINRKPCRLRDIFEMFMNTGVGREGYSIIGQGKIAEIISKKSEERRNFFEEAAGIAKYRHRKQESERKLAATEANMVREQDIFDELAKRLAPLEKEAEKARKYSVLMEEKKRADISLWLYDTKKLHRDIVKTEEAVQLSAHQLEIITENMESLERQADALEKQTFSGRIRSEEMVNSITRTKEELHAIDNRIQLTENEIRHHEELVARAEEQLLSNRGGKDALSKERQAYADKIAATLLQKEGLEAERERLLAEQQQRLREVEAFDRALEKAQQELDQIESEAVDYKVRVDVIKGASAEGEGKKSSLETDISQYEQTSSALQAEVARCEQSVAGFKTKLTDCEGKIQAAATEVQSLTKEQEALSAQLNEYRVNHDTLLERSHALRRMEEHFEGYYAGVRFVMQQAERRAFRGNIEGPISKIISIQPAYVTAIETALGSAIQHIVVDTEETGKEAIEALKGARAGRCTFLPVSAIRSAPETEEIRAAARYRGYISRADKLVSCSARHRPIVEWLLLRTVIFDNLDNAIAASKALKQRVKIVTLDGQTLNVGGSMTGGATNQQGSGILSRGAEINQILEQAKEIAGRIDTLKAQIGRLNTQINQVRQEERDAEQTKELLLTMSRAQFAALDAATAKLDANQNLLVKLRQDYEALQSSQERSGVELQSLSEKLSVLEGQKALLRQHRQQQAIERNACDDRRLSLGESANQVFLRITELAKDIEAAGEMMNSLHTRSESFESDNAEQQKRIAAWRQKIEQLQDLILQSEREKEAVRTRIDTLHSDRSELESDLLDYEKRTGELRAKIKAKTNEKELCFRLHTTNEAKLEQLRANQDRLGSHIYEDYELTYEQAVALDYPPVTPENRGEVAALLNSCRGKIKNLGGVNPNAVEEYREVKERYDALHLQLTDLKTSRDELLGIISRLENEMKVNFLHAFEQINRHFAIVFRELFGGGQAELLLTDPEDVLTCGIEIKVAPPGKIIKNLSLLSGGEQAFVAIALFFAILKVNPTPFCILDEIEAALDEVNVARFGDYIKRFCQQTQFILITHRRGTMEVANRLYGVTMPEKGISKVIGIHVDEIESKHKEMFDDIL